MTIEYFSVKVFRYFSLIALVVFLFLKYYQLPDMVAVFFNEKGGAAGFLPKSQFFYLISGTVIAIHFLVSFFKEYLSNKIKISPTEKIFKISKSNFLLLLQNSLNIIVGIIHVLIIISLLILAKLNTTEYDVTIFNYSWFPLVILILLSIGILAPIFRWYMYKLSN